MNNKEEAERLQEPEDQEVGYEIVSSIYMKEPESMTSQQYGHLNKTCTTVTLDNKSTELGKINKASPLDEKSYRQLMPVFSRNKPIDGLVKSKRLTLNKYMHEQH